MRSQVELLLDNQVIVTITGFQAYTHTSKKRTETQTHAHALHVRTYAQINTHTRTHIVFSCVLS